MKRFLLLLATVTMLSCCSAPQVCVRQPVRLSESTQQVTVCSRTLWNQTGIQVRRGHTYRLTPSGCWTDWFVPSNASGPKSRLVSCAMLLMRPGLRLPPWRDLKANFFSLVVCIQEGESIPQRLPEDAFLVGKKGLTWTASKDGQLLAFANDWKIAYGNNKGSLTLEVEEVKPAR